MRPVTLADKFELREGSVFITGTQALIRILLDQRRRDRAAGLNTAGFISGYRGSPLGGLDHGLWESRAQLKAEDIVFTPGVNEELAATAVAGAQHLSAFGDARVEGVFSAWYGKGPGVDRAGDALKHGALAGASANGGVLVFAGDDHTAKSSTTAHQSEQALAAAFIPVIYPANVEEFAAFGAFGFAMSRFAGVWTGFKCVNETADATSTARLDLSPPRFRLPDVAMPPGGLNHVVGDPQAMMERRTVEFRLPAAQAFARANGIDRTVIASRRPGLAIVTAGKAYLDVREALRLLDLDEARASTLGVSLLKLGLVWPADGETLQRFAVGAREVLVVEEKRPLIEDQAKAALYHLPKAQRPDVSGKTTPGGEPLLPLYGEVTPALAARAIANRLAELGLADAALLSRAEALVRQADAAKPPPITEHMRAPFFCSGCPHNTSTVVPEGAVALSGIGCHVMAAFMPHRKHVWPVQMGGEGANWVGAAPFSKVGHVFQNLGDGTFYHSGLLAIRAAVSAKVNITYKLLFNDAVAMTGGQPVEGALNPLQIARELQQEGVARVVIVADDLDRYAPVRAELGEIPLHPREMLDEIQREFAATPGVTAIIYDQVCAAEMRRRRKRGLYPDPDQRLFINEAVCEGCGDCGAASNCVSLQPVETDFGRKRKIDQSSCNKDFSCVNGFCPSFVTVKGGRPRARATGRAAPVVPPLPEAHVVPLDRPYGCLVTGIGGTGVITIGAVLGMAAHLEGKSASIMDMTGLSQKNGAVFSHVKVAASAEALTTARIADGNADLLLACDMLAAAAAEPQATLDTGRTKGIVNSAFTPTAAFTFSPDINYQSARTARALASRLDGDGSVFIDATGIATRLMGDSIMANMFLLGVAAQSGLLPVGLAAIEAAVKLNGVAVEANLMALRLGRWAAVDPAAVDRLAGPEHAAAALPTGDEDVAALIERRAAHLHGYQNAAYARAFRDFVTHVQSVERRIDANSTVLTEAVARGLSKLMAYKDEYEVARLFTDGSFRKSVEAQFDGDVRLSFHMAPPLVAPPKAGRRPRKVTFGPWMMPTLHVLARLKGLRGGPLDPFGWTHERKLERRLIDDYRTAITEALPSLEAGTLPVLVELARLPEQIRGYGHVKLASIEKAKAREKELRKELAAAGSKVAA